MYVYVYIYIYTYRLIPCEYFFLYVCIWQMHITWPIVVNLLDEVRTWDVTPPVLTFIGAEARSEDGWGSRRPHDWLAVSLSLSLSLCLSLPPLSRYVYIYMYINISMYVYIYTYLSMYANLYNIHIDIYIYTHTYMSMKHAYIYIHMSAVRYVPPIFIMVTRLYRVFQPGCAGTAVPGLDYRGSSAGRARNCLLPRPWCLFPRSD